MRMLKLLVLALCIGGCMLTAWLIYPDSMEQAMAYFSEESNHVTSRDISIFLESITSGFTIGFYVLKWFFGRRGDHKRVKEIEADQWELKTIFLLISAGSFINGGGTFYEASPVEAMVHWAIGAACLMITLWGYVRKHHAVK